MEDRFAGLVSSDTHTIMETQASWGFFRGVRQDGFQLPADYISIRYKTWAVQPLRSLGKVCVCVGKWVVVGKSSGHPAIIKGRVSYKV